MPGDLVVWFLILIEITTFGLMFLAFSGMRVYDRTGFLEGQATLHPIAGLINTLALLTASGFVAQGVAYNRGNKQQRAAIFLWAGVASAMVYVVVKSWEYWQLGAAGHSLNDDHFFVAYFLITGFHLLHVLVGIGILGYMAVKLKQLRYGSNNAFGLESGASCWHMIDLIWVILFPIVYVIQ